MSYRSGAMSVQSHRHTPLAVSLYAPLVRRLRRNWHSHRQTLDPETLPDYLKRDLGLIGGRAALPRDPLRD
jgi:hypothetical protein